MHYLCADRTCSGSGSGSTTLHWKIRPDILWRPRWGSALQQETNSSLQSGKAQHGGRGGAKTRAVPVLLELYGSEQGRFLPGYLWSAEENKREGGGGFIK